MNRGSTYSELAKELGLWRQQPIANLLAAIGTPPPPRFVLIDQEDIEISVRVRWIDARKKALSVTAAAYGPSCWRFDRMEESVIVATDPDDGKKICNPSADF